MGVSYFLLPYITNGYGEVSAAATAAIALWPQLCLLEERDAAYGRCGNGDACFSPSCMNRDVNRRLSAPDACDAARFQHHTLNIHIHTTNIPTAVQRTAAVRTFRIACVFKVHGC